MPRFKQELSLSAIAITDRFPLNPSTLALVDFLRDGGTVPPIHVEPYKEGVFRVLDGRHRFIAYKLLGRKTISVRYGTYMPDLPDTY